MCNLRKYARDESTASIEEGAIFAMDSHIGIQGIWQSTETYEASISILFA